MTTAAARARASTAPPWRRAGETPTKALRIAAATSTMPIAIESAVGHASRHIAAASRSKATARASVSSARRPHRPPRPRRTACRARAPVATGTGRPRTSGAGARWRRRRRRWLPPPDRDLGGASWRAATRPTASAAATNRRGPTPGREQEERAEQDSGRGRRSTLEHAVGVQPPRPLSGDHTDDADQRGRCTGPNAATDRRRGGRRGRGVGDDVGQRVLRARRRLTATLPTGSNRRTSGIDRIVTKLANGPVGRTSPFAIGGEAGRPPPTGQVGAATWLRSRC